MKARKVTVLSAFRVEHSDVCHIFQLKLKMQLSLRLLLRKASIWLLLRTVELATPHRIRARKCRVAILSPRRWGILLPVISRHQKPPALAIIANKILLKPCEVALINRGNIFIRRCLTSYAKFLMPICMRCMFIYARCKADDNVPPATDLPFPFNIRSSIFFWNIHFADNKPFIPAKINLMWLIAVIIWSMHWRTAIPAIRHVTR